MYKITRVLSAFYIVINLNTTVIAKESTAPSLTSGVTVSELAHQHPVHWISIPQIEKSLSRQAPMVVGFDVDDTLLFASPGFYRGEREFSPGGRTFLKNTEFWEKMNNDWDAFSIPKQSGRELIAMHLQRGDKIFFITARMPTKTETLTKTLQDSFLIPEARINPVIFAGDIEGPNSKTQLLLEKQVKLYYGDSDNDILAAKAAGARGIRVLRASNSHYQPLHKAGALGEEVIVNSEY